MAPSRRGRSALLRPKAARWIPCYQHGDLVAYAVLYDGPPRRVDRSRLLPVRLTRPDVR